MSFGKRFLHGAGLSLMEHVVKTASLFVTYPLMNHALGTATNGYWLLFMSALGWFGLLDLGVSFTTTRFLSQAIGAKDEERQGTVLHIATKHFQRMSLITAIGSTLVFLAMPLWFAPPEEYTVAKVLVAVLPAGLTLALRFWYRLPQLRLRAWVRYDLLAFAAIIRTILQSVALIIFLPRYHSLLVVGYAQAGGDLVELGLQTLFARKLPKIGTKGKDDDKLRREMMAFTRDMMFGTVGDGLRSYIGPFTVGQVNGLAAVPIFSAGTRLVTMMEDVVNALFGGGILALFGQLHGADGMERLRKEFARLSQITAGFGCWAVGGLVLFGGAFIKRWMGPEFDRSQAVILIIAAPYALRFMQYAAHSLLYTLGWQRPMVIMRCVGGIVAGTLAIVLGIFWGIKGVAAGCAIEMGLSYGIVVPILVGRALHVTWWRYLLSDVLVPGLKGAILPAAAAFTARAWIQPDYPMLVQCFALYGAVFAVTAPFTLLNAEGRAMIRRALGRSQTSA